MNKELIEKMKQNRVPNCLLTDEEYNLLETVNPLQLQWFYKFNWLDNNNSTSPKCSNFIYRIKADYQPPQEPKVVKCEVRIYNCQLTFNHYGFCYCLTKAIELPNFSHYEYDDGSESSKSRISADYRTKPAQYPKYVVFIESEK